MALALDHRCRVGAAVRPPEVQLVGFPMPDLLPPSDARRLLSDRPWLRDLQAPTLAAEASAPQAAGGELMAMGLQRPVFRALVAELVALDLEGDGGARMVELLRDLLDLQLRIERAGDGAPLDGGMLAVGSGHEPLPEDKPSETYAVAPRNKERQQNPDVGTVSFVMTYNFPSTLVRPALILLT